MWHYGNVGIFMSLDLLGCCSIVGTQANLDLLAAQLCKRAIRPLLT